MVDAMESAAAAGVDPSLEPLVVELVSELLPSLPQAASTATSATAKATARTDRVRWYMGSPFPGVAANVIGTEPQHPGMRTRSPFGVTSPRCRPSSRSP